MTELFSASFRCQASARIAASLAGALLIYAATSTAPAQTLDQGWTNPPSDARLRAYWWWLNGNATSNSVTRDLEEMKAKGFGGALICDADGASQDGNDKVPHGPTFFSPEWRALYKHTLNEAARLGLEMSLNIQSGWNLGGPPVSADDAAKKVVWTELRVTGPTNLSLALARPKVRDDYYRDQFVVAYRVKPDSAAPAGASVSASSEQTNHPASDAADGSADSYWVSNSDQAGQGPSRARPQWLQFTFPTPVSADRLTLTPRPGYGPRECEVQVSDDGKAFRAVKAFAATAQNGAEISFPAVTGSTFRIAFYGAFDPRSADAPRNVQVAELKLAGPGGALSVAGAATSRKPLQNWEVKAIHKPLMPFSAPDSAPLFQEFPATPGEEDTRAADVLDLTAKLDKSGVLHWAAPAGEWQILRFGCTIGDHSFVSTSSDGWKGYAVDVLDAGAFQRYWDAVVEPLIRDAGPLAGKTLRYLHTDSWEVEPLNWTPTLVAEFRKLRGYDPVPFLPVLAGRIVNSRQESDRFLNDFRLTIGDLTIQNHYRLFREGAHRHGMEIHPESGGPHSVPIDAQRCLGFNDAPMSEFWATSWRHRVGDDNRFFVKQPASAAHTYGRKLVLAEGFTTIGPHWQETLWDNLKPSFDKALCEGLNLLVWHAFVCSPAEMGIPGQQYFAGTHLNPNVTWWSRSGPFFDYVNRCQWMLQQGRFVADVAYYYGDHVPNFTRHKLTDPARVLPGYDYDVVTEEILLTRASVDGGRLTLANGMSYRILVLPDRAMISLPVLRKLKEFVNAGATVIGPKPTEATTMKDFPQCDAEVAKLAEELWGKPIGDGDKPLSRRIGKGRVITGMTARQVLETDGVPQDFRFIGEPDKPLDYVHRRDGDTEIYFVANRTNLATSAACAFRVTGKAPELWNAVTGERRFADAYTGAPASGPASPPNTTGVTFVPLEFAPCGSWFVVFRVPVSVHPATITGNVNTNANSPQPKPLAEITGPWTVKFDPSWAGPASVEFPELVSWTKRTEPGIKFYSGTATYTKTFDVPDSALRTPRSALWLDLGNVRELAEVRVNGQPCGIVWTPPFRVNIAAAVKPGANKLEVDVVNFWPNRLIGDAALPVEKRLTKTNIRKLTKDTPLVESGLFGPVRLLE